MNNKSNDAGQSGPQTSTGRKDQGVSDLSSIATIIGLLRPLSARDRLQVMKAAGGAFNLTVLPTNSVQPARRAEKPTPKPQTKAKKSEKVKVDPYAPIDNEEYKRLRTEIQAVSRDISQAAKENPGIRLPPDHHLVLKRESLKAQADAIRIAETTK